MAHFVSGAGTVKTPFGKNVYLRSTAGCKFESYTLAAATVPSKTIDGVSGQKVLQSGVVMAKIASGPDQGKIGPYQAAGTAEVQTITPTAVTAGTFTATLTNPVTGVARTTAPIAWNATQAALLAALVALDNVEPADLAVGGAATVNAGAITVTFFGAFIGNPAQMTLDVTLLTATSLVVTTSTAGVAGAADGRGDKANIVGILDTFLPWQTMERDVEVGVLYEGTVVQAWCFEYDAAGNAIAMQNATTDLLVGAAGTEPVFRSKRLDIKFV